MEVRGMHTNQLAYFVEVAKQGSISKAAKNLFISQPSLSAAIAKLEEEWGVKLFYRSQNGARLTEQGQQILTVSEEILKRLAEIERIAKQDRHLSGEVKLAVIPLVCGGYTADLVALAQKRYPHLAVVINEERSKVIIQQVLSGAVNLGITSFRLDQQAVYEAVFQKKRIIYEPLFTGHLCAFVGSSHPLAQKQTVSIKEVNRYPQTCFPKDIALHEVVDYLDTLEEPGVNGDWLASLDLTVFKNIVYRFSDLNSIKQIAARNLAIAILPRQGNEDTSASWQLKPLEINDVDLSFAVGLVRNAGGILSRAEECLIEMLKEISLASPLCT